MGRFLLIDLMISLSIWNFRMRCLTIGIYVTLRSSSDVKVDNNHTDRFNISNT